MGENYLVTHVKRNLKISGYKIVFFCFIIVRKKDYKADR